jgi:hypothetical protein
MSLFIPLKKSIYLDNFVQFSFLNFMKIPFIGFRLLVLTITPTAMREDTKIEKVIIKKVDTTKLNKSVLDLPNSKFGLYFLFKSQTIL